MFVDGSHFSTSTVEIQNILILLKLIEGMNHTYNGHNSYFSLQIHYQLNTKNGNVTVKN